jgi:putative flippase GtrA/SAM-dependent methyltransferase
VATVRSQRRFLPFVGVGAIGFAVDAGVLTLLVNGFDWGHYEGRAISFPCAVTVTWLCHRHWVFERTSNVRKEYAQYLSMQLVGATLNLCTYVALIETFPMFERWPVVPLAIGGIVALLFNFNIAKYVVFARPASQAAASRRPETSPPDAHGARADAHAYSGLENLEAMENAHNYNAHLRGLVERHAVAGRRLDFGAGSGTFAKAIAAAGHDLVCVEPDQTLRAELTEAGLDAVAALDAVPRGSIDYVYTLNVLEHVEDDVGALVGLNAALVPGGRLLIYVPAFELLYSAMDRRVGHFRRYRKQMLAEKLAKAGFIVRRARYVDSLGFLASLVYKAVGDDSGVVSARSVGFYDRWLFPLSRAADLLLGRFVGKNLLVVATAVAKE